MEAAVRCHSQPPSAIRLLASILLLATGLAIGCTADRPLRPARAIPPEYAAPALVLEASGEEILRVSDRDVAEALLESLPGEERRSLLDAGVLTTRDPDFITAVRRLIATDSGDRTGFGAHIRRVTWGEIKIRYAT